MYSTWAFSVAKLTVAVTPSILLSFFSIRAAQDAHVIPPICSSTLPVVIVRSSSVAMSGFGRRRR
jgi:hypothetical protein